MKHIRTEKEFNEKWDPVYKQRIEASHLTSAPETRERLAKLEVNQINVMEKLIEFQKVNKEEHQDIIESLDKFHNRTNESIKEVINKLDDALDKKADKSEVDRIRGIIQWVSYTIIGTLLVGLVALIIKQ